MAERIYKEHLIRDFGINRGILDYLDQMEEKLGDSFQEMDEICAINQLKVLKAFQDNNINDTHFGWNTG